MARLPQFRAAEPPAESQAAEIQQHPERFPRTSVEAPIPTPPRAVSSIPVTGNTSYEMMSVGELLTLPKADFHPPLNDKRVQAVAADFDPDVMEPPSIAVHYGNDIEGHDISGQLVIYEGRHRLESALIAKGADWMTLVRVTRGSRKAAQLFASLNGSRRKFGAIENYNARLSAGEKTQQRVQEIAAVHGFSVGGTRTTARGQLAMGGKGVWHINAITALYDALTWGEEILDNALDVIAAVTRAREERGEPAKVNTWTTAKVIQGVAYLLNLFESELDTDILIRALTEVPPHVAAPVNANSAGQNALAMAQLYNAQFVGRGASRLRLRLEKIPLRNR